MNCCYQCPYMVRGTFNSPGCYCPYYYNFYYRQEEGFEVEEEYPPQAAPGTFLAVDPSFARRVARRCEERRRPRLEVTLNNGQVITLRDFEAGEDSLVGTNVRTGDDEVLDYQAIRRLRCLRRRARNGNPDEYEYGECDCREQ
ncbi:hypothetical protein [Clostridium aciditolerans]|uniref:Uncharacterized protein n=1 Tax=Clostridium aciditolerans TaxID=339861 RepID=A0A934HUK8_9CLOT|nr:hypothetical protein [Clostridium aciditolerans]MBI6874851.1 hypothetical protein [Clostridium aciditolerans]